MSSSQSPTTVDKTFMSNFSLSLIHKILLTDPVDFPNLTMNGNPKPKQLYFYEFVKQRGFPIIFQNNESDNDNNGIGINPSLSIEERISQTMHRAYIDLILKEMEQESQTSYKPLENNILEIHGMLRSLIPNRPDLHSYLKDEDIRKSEMDTFEKLVDILKQVGDALSMLESEYRAETTKQWIDIMFMARDSYMNTCNKNSDNYEYKERGIDEAKFSVQILKPTSVEEASKHLFSMTLTSFALASTTFLHYKTELCQAETADFQLGHILAPRIYSMGKEYLFQKFQERFEIVSKSYHETNTSCYYDEITLKLPNSVIWIKEMIENSSYTKDELLVSDEKRDNVLLQTGWIDNLLFRSPRLVNDEDAPSSTTQLLMPEVLWLDSMTIQSIRMTTKLTVAGSVLSLHAASAAGVSESIFRRDPLDCMIQEYQRNLLTVMKDRNVGSQEIYENNIADAVVDLAKALNPKIETEVLQSLRNRSNATLKGEDPVIKLLDNRMKDIFRSLMVIHPEIHQQVPTSLKTGRSLSLTAKMSSDLCENAFNTSFKNAAKKKFVTKGFAFYSDELVEASHLAYRTINLVKSIYGGQVLEGIFLKACSLL